jgi:hypothetical protein
MKKRNLNIVAYKQIYKHRTMNLPKVRKRTEIISVLTELNDKPFAFGSAHCGDVFGRVNSNAAECEI